MLTGSGDNKQKGNHHDSKQFHPHARLLLSENRSSVQRILGLHPGTLARFGIIAKAFSP
jgi:hypothetical protein